MLGTKFLLSLLIMVFGLFKPKSGASVAKASDTGTCSSSISNSRYPSIEDGLRNALWAFFAGDALAMPTHWYYGGLPQIQRDYSAPITGYTKPVFNLPGSILNKSNINGGGRGSFQKTSGISIIGDVINHGKREYWDPNKQIHYHATLQSGENTLEAQLARVLMKSIVQNKGQFHAQHFRDAYVQFMMTPGSHNDAYASTCHRMFFANHVLHKLPLDQCPDNDHHNVDTIDGLVLPTITSLAMAAAAAAQAQAGGGDAYYSLEEIEAAAAATAAVTRKSAVLEKASRAWGRLVASALLSSSSSSHNGDDDDKANGDHNNLNKALAECAKALGMKQIPSANLRQQDQMTACYLDSALPATLDMIAKYSAMQQQQQHQQQQQQSTGTTSTIYVVWSALLSNANCGGENVHRGSILGAVLGAAQAQYHYSKKGCELDEVNLQLQLQQQQQLFRDGLYHEAQLKQEIDDFVKAVLKK